MRGFKLTVAIFTLLQGIGLTVPGVVAIIWGGIAIGSRTGATEGWGVLGDALGTVLGGMMIGVGIVVIAIGIPLIILGAKFCSTKPNRGIAITLIVLYSLLALGSLPAIPAGLLGTGLAILMIVFLAVYLSKLGKHQRAQMQQAYPQNPPPQQVQTQNNFCPKTGQPLNPPQQ